MPSIKHSNSRSPSTKSTIEWSGRVVKVEENRTWYRKFSKEGIQYQLEEFVLLKPKNGGGSKVVQINQLWEEKKGTQVKRLLKGKLFTVSVPSSLQDNVKNNPDGFQILELLPTATDNAEYSIDSVDSKCHVKIVKDLKEVPNLKSSSRQSNRIYFLQSEYAINENKSSSPTKSMHEENGTPSPQKQNKKAHSDANVSPTKHQNHNGTPNSGKRKGSENGVTDKKLSKKPKLLVPTLDQPETPKKRIVQSADDGSDSEEDKQYRKSLKRRLALEQQERQANREAREKWDQQNLNTKFFRLAHRRPDEEEQYQRLIEANLFEPSPLPADYEEPVQSTSIVKSKYALVVPGYQENPDYEDIISPQIDKDFWKSYRKGYIVFDPPEDIRETPLRESRVHSNPLTSPIHHHASQNLVAKYFEPTIWADVEVLLFKELLCADGCDWHKIANLMMSKKALQLELYYIDNRYDLSCQICGSTSDDAHLLLCDGCDRAYHLYCMDPPLSQVPNRQWFCTKECELINRMRCGSCGLKDEQKSTLLCDLCDKAFHLSCVNPPLTSAPPSWICVDCVAMKAAAAVSPPTADLFGEQPVTKVEESKEHVEKQQKEKEKEKQKEDPQTPRPPTPRTLRRKKKLEIDFSDLLPEVPSPSECKPANSSTVNNNNNSSPISHTNNQNAGPSISNNALSIALGTVNATNKLPTSPKEFNLHQIGMLSPLSSPLNKSPSPQKLSKATKMHKTATKIAESVIPTFIYDDIRLYASKCVQEINFLGLREDNLARVSYSTLFSYFPDVSESKLGDYFDSILTAVDVVVNRAIANPVFSSQLSALQQQEHDQRLFAYVHVKKSNHTQTTNNIKTTNQTSRTPTNKIIRPRKKLRKTPSDATRAPTTTTPRRKNEKEDDDGFGTQPRAWIFQANNTMYNIEKSVKELKHMTWFIKQHIHKIRAGDRVFIWVSGKDAGVIAVGTVLTDPASVAEAKGMKEYYLSAKMFNVVALRSVLRIDYVLPKRIEKAKLAKHSVLSKLTILRQPIGTNFKLTKVEATNLEQFITDAAGSDISELIPAFSSEDVPGVLAQMNASNDDDNNNNNNAQPVLDNNAQDTNITNNVSKTTEPVTQPPPESMEVDIKCEVCNSTSGDDQMLLCDGCDKGYHIYCLNPPLEQIPEDSWFCQACEHKVSHCKLCNGPATEDAPLVVCHQCHIAYHSACMNIPVEASGIKWFCEDCQLSPQEITACKLYIGFQELHLVCRRLIQDKCEEVSRQHKKNMQTNHPPKKVLSRLQHLIAQLSQMRLNVLNSANMSFQAWKESLVDSAAQVPNCNNSHLRKMDEDL